MPPRLNQADVKALFAKYGYIVPDNFTYRNNKQKFKVYDEQNDVYEHMSLQQLQYHIRRGNRQPYFDPVLMSMPLSSSPAPSSQAPGATGYERWFAQQREGFLDDDAEDQQAAYNYYKRIMPVIGHRRNTTITFNDDGELVYPKIYGLVQALRTLDYSKYEVCLTIRSGDAVTYRWATQNTINFLYESFFEHQDVQDSFTATAAALVECDSVDLEFYEINDGNERPGGPINHRRAPGFFPFTHTVDGLDLSKYAIYRHEDDIVNESCLITAFRSSNLLSADQMQLLQSMIRTRHVLKSSLKHIAETFNIHINVKTVTDYETCQTSHTDYCVHKGCKGKKSKCKHPLLKLLIMYDHYVLNETVSAPTLFGNNRKMSPQRVVKKLLDDNLLTPLSDGVQKKLVASYEQTSDQDIDCDLCYRPLQVKDPKAAYKGAAYRYVQQTKRFFGYTPEEGEVTTRLSELQDAINKLPLRNRIDVSKYYRFSELGQKILYETGCFDGVYELTGKPAHDIRSTLTFPKTRIATHTPTLYMTGELYYLDLNAAYMNFVKSIPSGRADGYVNTTVESVIKQLYKLRLEAKQAGNNKLATTLKFIMNSTWGYSIQKPRVIKNKYVQKPDTYIQRFSRYVMKQDGHFISSVNCFVPHYTYPQFAKSVLDNYNKFFNSIKSTINVYYENVDAILTDRDGYNKLQAMGMIDDEQMGKFKVDKVFTEFAAISDRRWVARTADGEQVLHCIKNMNYDDVVRIAKH